MAFAIAQPIVAERQKLFGPGLETFKSPIVLGEQVDHVFQGISKGEVLAVRTSPLPPPSPPSPPPLPSPAPSPSPPQPHPPHSSTSSLHLREKATFRAQCISSHLVKRFHTWRDHISQSVESMVEICTQGRKLRPGFTPVQVFLLEENSSKGSENNTSKLRNSSMETRLAIIRDDFIQRQYYVTGLLTAPLYRDDCFFDAPDPGGRVRGVAKFCRATARLFDQSLSQVDLIDIYERDECYIVAEWRLQGALMLPWRPLIKPYLSSTIYEFDESGLVCNHIETWEISAFDAFLSVFWKGFGAPPAPPADAVRKLRKKNNRPSP